MDDGLSNAVNFERGKMGWNGRRETNTTTAGMPTYELVLILRKMPVVEIKSTLKRAAMVILETGGVIRKLENLGFKKLPYRIRGQQKVETEGNFFVCQFDSDMCNLQPLNNHLSRERDVIRQRVYFIEDRLNLIEKKHECDIYLDLLEVPERPHVQLMVELSKKKNRKPFVYGSGRDYDPLAK